MWIRPSFAKLPVKVGVPLAAPVVIEAVAEFDPEAETRFRDPAYALPASSPAAEPGRGTRRGGVGSGRGSGADDGRDRGGGRGGPARRVDAARRRRPVRRDGRADARPASTRPPGWRWPRATPRPGGWTRSGSPSAAGRLRPRLRVLTGLSRADRWRELRPAGLPAVLDAVPPAVRADGRGLRLLPGAGRGARRTSAQRRDPGRARGRGHRALRGRSRPDRAAPADPRSGRAARGAARRGAAGRGEPGHRHGDGLARSRPHCSAGAASQASAHLPADPAALDTAARAGATLAEIAPASPLRRSLVDLARTLTGAPDPTPSRRRRLFARR